MTDRSTPSSPTPQNPPPQGDGADALVQLYHQANAQDSNATGPSAACSARILAYAQVQANKRSANHAHSTATPIDLPAAPSLQTSFNGEPANDRRWLRHALGSLAAIGLVGLLTLHHLDEPGAPQLDSPAPVSQAASEPAQVLPAPAAAPAPAPAAESAPVAASATVAADTRAAADHSKEKSTLAQANSAPAAIKSEAKKEAENRPAASAPQDSRQRQSKSAPPSHAAASADTSAEVQAPAPASAAPRPSPTAPIARAPRSVEGAPAAAATANADRAAPAAAQAPASSGGRPNRQDELVALEPLQSLTKPAAKAKTANPQTLPYCDDSMDDYAQAEQTRRLKARDAAKTAGQPLPEPAPVCKPRPKTPAAPDIAPVDSR